MLKLWFKTMGALLIALMTLAILAGDIWLIAYVMDHFGVIPAAILALLSFSFVVAVIGSSEDYDGKF